MTAGRMRAAYLAAFGALAATALGCVFVVPVWRADRALGRLSARPRWSPLFWERELDEAARRLGGRRQAARAIGLYLRLPERLAPRRDEAVALLAFCGDEGWEVITDLTTAGNVETRCRGLRALGGLTANGARGGLVHLGPECHRAARKLVEFLGEEDPKVRAEAELALVNTGPAPDIVAAVYERCLAAAGWVVAGKEPIRHGEYDMRLYADSRYDSNFTRGESRRLVVARQTDHERLILGERRTDPGYHVYYGPTVHTLEGCDRPVLAFEQGTGGNGWDTHWLRLFLLEQDLPEITPALPSGWMTRELVDMDEDGRLELRVLVTEYEFYMKHCHVSSPACSRIFRWDHQAGGFLDVSAQCPEFYRREIAKDWEGMQLAPNNPWTGAPVSLLLDYWCLGRTEEGWRKFKDHMDRMKPNLDPKDRALVERMETDLRERLGIGGAGRAD